MTRIVTNTLRAIRRITSPGLDKRLRRQILTTYIRVILLGRYDSSRRIARVGQIDVEYCVFSSFRYLFHEIFVQREYHFVTQKESPFIVDCGSNIGMSILFFKLLYPNARVLGFEPSDEAFACLQKNVTTNKLTDVRVLQEAVSDKEGPIDFYVDPELPGSLTMSTSELRMPKQRRIVDGTLLSQYITEPVDFLKLDVEGAEDAVLEDLSRSGKLQMIDKLIIEYHHHINKDKDTLSKTLGLLENGGFGYQIAGYVGRPFKMKKFQNISIYAYKSK